MWGTISEYGVKREERWAICGGLERLKSPCQHVQIIGVTNACHVPTIGDEACCHIIGKGQGGIAFDGDVVVIINPAQVRELQMTGQRGSLVANTLHHAAVATDGVNVVIEHLKGGAVEVRSHPASGGSHANACRHTLTKGASGCLNSRGPAIFRMSRAFAA